MSEPAEEDRDVPLAARQQMAMMRPWDHADPESIWEISGDYPDGGGFRQCLAMTAPEIMTGHYGDDYRPVFFMIGPAIIGDRPIDPAWISRGRLLMLVDAGNPREAYWDRDQDRIDLAWGHV